MRDFSLDTKDFDELVENEDLDLQIEMCIKALQDLDVKKLSDGERAQFFKDLQNVINNCYDKKYDKSPDLSLQYSDLSDDGSELLPDF